MSTAEPLVITPLAHSREHLPRERADAAPSHDMRPETQRTGGAQRTHVSEHARRTPDMSAYFTYTDRPPASAAGATREAAEAEAAFAHATTYEAAWSTDKRPRKKQGRLAGAVQFAGGVACMAVGVPLLILPGPGLAMIAGGAVLATRGASNMLGKRRAR